jgi:ribosome biogenesis GTPase / thiamine phosphate phosphatase
LYTLEQLGWRQHYEPPAGELTEELIVARVAEEQRGAYVLFAERGPLEATVTGRLMHEASAREDYPAVGDWVLARPLPREERAVIVRTLPRRSRLSRKVAGTKVDEQIIAANVDVVFLVSSLNAELNPRRIERYLSVIWESGATPVILLNKADLAEEAHILIGDVGRIAPGVDVHATSAATGQGVDTLRGYLAVGQTSVFVGSSGVGKSSLVNRLLASETQVVSHISNYDKGRHTTTSRQMLIAPDGGLIIDTPGLRELGLWDADSGVGMTFADVTELAAGCAFGDCQHRSEPGCAVQAALDSGELPYERFESYRKLEREQAFIERKKDVNLREAERKKWKQISKANRKRQRSEARY